MRADRNKKENDGEVNASMQQKNTKKKEREKKIVGLDYLVR